MRPLRIAPVKASQAQKMTSPARAGAAAACQRRGHQHIILFGQFQSPVSTASQAVQSNEVYLPQEALNDLRKLVAAADKRRSLGRTNTPARSP
jgi:hypothetical protein